MIQRQIEPEEEEEEKLLQAKLVQDTQVQRQEEEEEEPVQTRRVSGKSASVGQGPASQVSSLRGSGRPLPRSVRNFYEPRFGYDFSKVRIYADSHAAEAARTLNAKAYTHGRDIVFGAGQYAPGTRKGRQLLAHELTHVVQQGPSGFQQQGKFTFAPKGTPADVHVGHGISSQRPAVQMQGRRASQICGGLTLQVPVPGIVPSPSITGTSTLKLGPFSCVPGKCQIAHGSQVMTIANVRTYYAALIKAAKFSKSLIQQISRYLKTVPATAIYKQFLKWLHRISGLKPAKPGATPSAAVAAETTAFISPAYILSEWLKLGHIKPPTGTNPFDNWISMLHEQHHRKTILGHSGIQQAYAQIKATKAALLANPDMMAPHDSNLRATAIEDVPQHLVTEQGAIRTRQGRVWRLINAASAGRLQVVGLKRLLTLAGLPNRKRVTVLVNKYKMLVRLKQAYSTTEYNLRSSLGQHYRTYEKWMQNARNFALEDLKAYCLSWGAEKKAIDFIKRCCGSALRVRRRRRRR